MFEDAAAGEVVVVVDDPRLATPGPEDRPQAAKSSATTPRARTAAALVVTCLRLIRIDTLVFLSAPTFYAISGCTGVTAEHESMP